MTDTPTTGAYVNKLLTLKIQVQIFNTVSKQVRAAASLEHGSQKARSMKYRVRQAGAKQFLSVAAQSTQHFNQMGLANIGATATYANPQQRQNSPRCRVGGDLTPRPMNFHA